MAKQSSLLVEKYVFIIFLFILCPFLAFIYSLFLPHSKYKVFIFCSFFFVIGCCFLLTNQYVDSYQHALDFINICKYGLIAGIGITNNEKLDFYTYFIEYLVSLFTHNPKFLFAIFATVYGYFVYQTNYTFSMLGANCKQYRFILYCVIVLAFLSNSHLNINGIRFGTGVWMFLYGFFSYLHGNKRAARLLYFTPLVHMTFVIPCLIFIVCKYFNNKIQLLIVIYVITFLLSQLMSYYALDFIYPIISRIPHFGAYVTDEYVSNYASVQNDQSVFTRLFKYILDFFKFTMILLVYQKLKISKGVSNMYMSFFVFSLLLFTFVNLCNLIPDAGRFNLLANPLFIYLMYSSYRYRLVIFDQKLLALLLLLAFSGLYYKQFFWHSYTLGYEYLYKSLFSILNMTKSFIFIS